jgi:hypothetical protein
MGMRRAYEGTVQHALQKQVCHILAPAFEQPGVFASEYGLAYAFWMHLRFLKRGCYRGRPDDGVIYFVI